MKKAFLLSSSSKNHAREAISKSNFFLDVSEGRLCIKITPGQRKKQEEHNYPYILASIFHVQLVKILTVLEESRPLKRASNVFVQLM